MIKFVTFNWLLYTESVEVSNLLGKEVDSSMDSMVGGTADKIKGFIGDLLCEHESPVNQNFADASNDDQQKQPQQQQPPAALSIDMQQIIVGGNKSKSNSSMSNRKRQHQPIAATAAATASATAQCSRSASVPGNSRSLRAPLCPWTPKVLGWRATRTPPSGKTRLRARPCASTPQRPRWRETDGCRCIIPAAGRAIQP